MLLNYFTLRALATEWNPLLRGTRLSDAYTQNPGSLILVFTDDSGDDEDRHWSLNISVQSPNRHIFLYEGTNRARRNTVGLFKDAVGRKLQQFALADRDRIMRIELAETDGQTNAAALIIVPFGPRANVFFAVDAEVRASFRGDATPPEPRSAPPIPAELEADSIKSLNRALPMFPKPLIREILHRLPADPTPEKTAATARELESQLKSPKPVVFWKGQSPELLSMTPLSHLDTSASTDLNNKEKELRREDFRTATAAVRVVARRRLGLRHFTSRYDPLRQAIENRLEHKQRSLEKVEEELARPSRADRYERWGHLLMAQPHAVNDAAESVKMEDIIDQSGTVRIALDPEKSAIENAEEYYERARRARTSRRHARERLKRMKSELSEFKKLAREIRDISDRDELDDFEKRHAGLVERLRADGGEETEFPYRRYELRGGYEVWVGRNARQNDQLTLHDSRKYDLWLHARGVAGSHTVLRVKGRKDNPPKVVIEQAAAIAAYHSKARTSGLAPVMVTERKYVRKPRNAEPGAVRVERENVLMVEPRLPNLHKR